MHLQSQEDEAQKLKESLTKRIDDLEIGKQNLENENLKIIQRIIDTLYATLEILKTKNELKKKSNKVAEEDNLVLSLKYNNLNNFINFIQYIVENKIKSIYILINAFS